MKPETSIGLILIFGASAYAWANCGGTCLQLFQWYRRKVYGGTWGRWRGRWYPVMECGDLIGLEGQATAFDCDQMEHWQ